MVDGIVPRLPGDTPGRSRYRDPRWVGLAIVVALLLIGVVLAYHWSRPVQQAASAPSRPVPSLPLSETQPAPDRPSPFFDSREPAGQEPIAAASPEPSEAKPQPVPHKPKSVPTRTFAFSLPSPQPAAAGPPFASVLPPPPALRLTLAATPAAHLPSTRRPYYAATATCEPVRKSRLQRMVRKVTGLRRIDPDVDSGEGFEPARPLRPVAFILPEGSSPELMDRKRMDVKARLEASGRVSRVELLSLPDQHLVTLLSYAANEWQFQPARMNGKPVDSELLLHFTLNTAR